STLQPQSTPDIPQTSPTQIYTHYFSTRPGLRTPPVKPQVPYTCLVCPKKDSITLLENTILANPAVPEPDRPPCSLHRSGRHRNPPDRQRCPDAPRNHQPQSWRLLHPADH